jgi:hypothetical protein
VINFKGRSYSLTKKLLKRNLRFVCKGLVFFCLMLSPDAHAQHESLKYCTFSSFPILGKEFLCRQKTKEETERLKVYWRSEGDAELCHYFYFPLADPSASKELLLENYLIMQNEIALRRVDCMKDHRNIFWYRGKGTKSMLEKLIIKYNLNLEHDYIISRNLDISSNRS